MFKNKEFLSKIIIASGVGYSILSKYNDNIFYDNLSEQHTKELFENKKPLLLACNHMTLIDSVILNSYLSSVFGYYGLIKNDFRPFVWNLPAKENLELLKNNHDGWLAKSFFYEFGRIVPIERDNPESSKKTLEQVVDMMLNDNHVFNIFPEAGRTRREEFSKEDMTPGASKIIYDVYKKIKEVPNVLCVYLRSKSQKGYSDLPQPGKITIVARKLDVSNLILDKSDLRNKKEISNLIGNQLEKNQIVWKSLAI
jgi:hypothetical protein